MKSSRTRAYRRDASVLFPVFFLPFFLLGSLLKAENTPQRALQEFKTYCQQIQDVNRRQALETHLAKLQAFFKEYCLREASGRKRNGTESAAFLNLPDREELFRLPAWLGHLLSRSCPDIETSQEKIDRPDLPGSAGEDRYRAFLLSAGNETEPSSYAFPASSDTRSFQNGSWASTLPAYPF